MGPRYEAIDAAGRPVAYRDRKRAWWALSVVYPLLPFAGIAAHAWSGRQIALGLPLVVSYGLMPLLDFLIGEDRNNPPEEVVPALEEERYYRWLTWATVPLHFVALVGCAAWVGTHLILRRGSSRRFLRQCSPLRPIRKEAPYKTPPSPSQAGSVRRASLTHPSA